MLLNYDSSPKNQKFSCNALNSDSLPKNQKFRFRTFKFWKIKRIPSRRYTSCNTVAKIHKPIKLSSLSSPPLPPQPTDLLLLIQFHAQPFTFPYYTAFCISFYHICGVQISLWFCHINNLRLLSGHVPMNDCNGIVWGWWDSTWSICLVFFIFGTSFHDLRPKT